MLTRRRFLAVLGTSGAAMMAGRAFAQATLPKVTVTKDPNCGCCGGWVEHMKAAGFPVEVITSSDVDQVKLRLGVPGDLASCHTAEVSGYVVEGHVPAAQVIELTKRDDLLGIAVPGMPAGSPGMEVDGVQHAYQVIGLTKTGSDQVVAEYPAQ